MKAIVRDEYGTPDVLRYEEVPTPVPSSGQVRVAVHRASVNTADLDQVLGRPSIVRIASGLSRPRSQRVGLDVAGVVESVGEGVTRLRPGDRVWADTYPIGGGAFAEFVCGPEKAFFVMPDELTMSEAATLPHSGVLAKQGLEVGRGVESEDRVLINGAGGCVGPFAVQIAKSRGAHVTGVDHSSKLDVIRTAGADEVLDYTKTDFTRPGGQFDYILDIAARRSLVAHRRALASSGVYVHIARTVGGFFRAAVFGGILSVTSSKRLGIWMWKPNQERDLSELARLVANGSITPLIDTEFSLAEVPTALTYLAEGRARGKLLVAVSG